MSRRWLIPFSVCLLVLLAVPAGALPSTAPQCFTIPGIEECIDGRFREYWNDNGGLPVFGYPITPERPEVNRDTNKSYATQWFERNRFELHTENRQPYDVLLGRLGAELLTKQGRGFERNPATPTGRCRMFDVGGQQQAVCDPFLRYWQDHGLEFDGRAGKSYEESLALFGLPLTYPKKETNPNGDTVLTQWFERARFEDHGGKGVLLGLLGGETLRGAPTSPSTQVRVDIRDFSFQPPLTQIKVGTTVVWTNRDSLGHTATQGNSPTPGGVFDSGLLAQGQSFSFTFTKAGVYNYFCRPHPYMQGTIQVSP